MRLRDETPVPSSVVKEDEVDPLVAEFRMRISDLTARRLTLTAEISVFLAWAESVRGERPV